MNMKSTIVTPEPIGSTLVVQPTIKSKLEVGQGPAGRNGVDGSGDLHFQHTQGVASDLWVINHNLNKFPVVTVKDSSGDEVEGDLHYDGPNSLTLSFSAPFGGVAYLN